MYVQINSGVINPSTSVLNMAPTNKVSPAIGPSNYNHILPPVTHCECDDARLQNSTLSSSLI